MNVVQTSTFRKIVKKLYPNQKKAIDEAIKTIINNPSLGQQKVGDLSGIYVYKFKMIKQLTLLAYTYDDQTITITLLTLGSHENFYRDLKKL
jgi:mRNA-degrading endonuclease RelE of RelBE toxin-antitoxin system